MEEIERNFVRSAELLRSGVKDACTSAPENPPPLVNDDIGDARPDIAEHRAAPRRGQPQPARRGPIEVVRGAPYSGGTIPEEWYATISRARSNEYGPRNICTS
jgi:hypothetical protein